MARSGQPPPPPSFPKALTMRPLGIHVDPTGLHMVPIWVRTDPYAQAVHMACVPYGAVKNPREIPPIATSDIGLDWGPKMRELQKEMKKLIFGQTFETAVARTRME